MSSTARSPRTRQSPSPSWDSGDSASPARPRTTGSASASPAWGDVNGDGYDDVGAVARGGSLTGEGPAYGVVAFGGPSGTDLDVTNPLPAGRGFFIDLPASAIANDDFVRIARLGDTNGDGRDDLAVALPSYRDEAGIVCSNDPSTVCGDGLVWVLYGRKSAGTVDVEQLGTGGYRIRGEAENHHAGRTVTGIGDVNGDGLADLAVGAPGNFTPGVFGGFVYVVFGSEFGDDFRLGEPATDRGYRILGPDGEEAGLSLAAPGDVNGDGRPDLAIGSERSTANGRVWVLFLPATRANPIDLADLNGTEGHTTSGPGPGQRFAFSLGAAGDGDRDGLADIAIGAPDGDDGATNDGSVYVVRGSSSGQNVTAATLGDRGCRYEGTKPNGFAGYSVGVAGDIEGDGRRDLAIGGAAISTVWIEGLTTPEASGGDRAAVRTAAMAVAAIRAARATGRAEAPGAPGNGGSTETPDRAVPRVAIGTPSCGKRSATQCKRFRRTAAAWRLDDGQADGRQVEPRAAEEPAGGPLHRPGARHRRRRERLQDELQELRPRGEVTPTTAGRALAAGRCRRLRG